MRKILILTPQTPFPPDQGAPIRNYNFIKYLGNSGKYAITLLSFARQDEDKAAQQIARTELAKYCQRVELVPHPNPRSKVKRLVTLALNRKPDLALRLASAEFAEQLRRLVQEERPEVILCEALELAPFVMELAVEHHAKLVLDEHNAEYLLQYRAYESDRRTGIRRWPAAAYSFVQAARLRRYESAALGFFDAAIAVSEGDKAALEKLGKAKRVEVIPNGIDLSEYSPSEDITEISERLVFTGSMDFRPNVDAVTWFGREVWPLIRREKPTATFYIVGRRPSPAVQSLSSLPGITVTGKVPDARPHVREAALYIVPMRMGGGVRFKVLEALALGKAVLTTSMGADGINLTPGIHAEVADSAEDFAAAAIALLNDQNRRRELAEKGRRFVAQNFDWDKITPLLDEGL
jgi:sugar transferase (PEP-CTERM/EpsH1 system associated)